MHPDMYKISASLNVCGDRSRGTRSKRGGDCLAMCVECVVFGVCVVCKICTLHVSPPAPSALVCAF